jgi:signal peptidase I
MRVRFALRLARLGATWAAIGAAAVLVLVLALPLAFHGRPLTVLSGSMEPALHTGDVAVVTRIGPLDARVGDVVTFRDPKSGRLVTHRLRSVRAHGGRVEFVTKGDANNAVERWSLGRDEHLSRAMVRVPAIGRLFALLRSRLGMFLLVVVPLLLLAVVEIASIWRPERRKAEGDAPA